MVTDPRQVKQLLKEFFDVHGVIKVRPSGIVDVAGTVTLKSDVHLPNNRLPIQFGDVAGSFEFNSYKNLATLEGSPHFVGKTFDCSVTYVGSLVHAPQKVDGDVDVRFCDLKNFVGGPQKVGTNYWGRRNDVTSLEGLPDLIPGELDFELTPGLPILRSLVAERVDAMQGIRAIEQVNVILNKYVGQGKAGALKAAGELIKAGYKEHARW